MTAPILIIADRADWPTDRVVTTLTDRGAEVFRMDTADFPQEVSLTAGIDPGRPWSGELRTALRAVALDQIGAVYYRAPNAFRFPHGMSEAERKFAFAQARAGFGGVLAALTCRWVNHPAAIARAEYKPQQLAVARAVGLRIPPTLITNQPENVRAFAAQTQGPLVCKPIASPVLIEGDQFRTVYTRRLEPGDLADLRGIQTTAHLFQAWIDKAHEIRLTVVGDRMFAAEIHAGSQAAHVDWRSDYASLEYRPTQLPDEVTETVRVFMDRMNLRFAALDFIVDPQGRHWFLEANSCGQWDWIQHATGLPIAEAIADDLQGATTP
ncbi:ATP-grasp ribosomal peptide maturase [Streptomyces megasporus]|uniref:ATP-grasp ribosomal peptide maturase n=1 Tax=Streptomyces megasporus TaxID=44060 RepID=UPI0004E23C0B|nr:ATP-grasp ribosomal peptide maturase [Streptomyces megasporus]